MTLQLWMTIVIITIIHIQTYDAKAPNIIFIVVDDLGYDDLGFTNDNQIRTPNIDKIKSNGQFLEYYYGQCYCTPTRKKICID